MSAGSTPAGWYPDVERPGGERYWDGIAWTDHRRSAMPPPPGETPSGPVAPSPLGDAPSGPATPTPSPADGLIGADRGPGPYHSRAAAGWALGLSIAGLVLFACCGVLLSVPGAIIGWTQMQAVDRGERTPSARPLAKGGFVVGVIGIGVFLALVALYLVLAAIGST